MRVVEYEIANRVQDERGPIRLITIILDPESMTAAELAAAYIRGGSSRPASPRSKPASAAAAECCARTVPRWWARRSGDC